MGSDRLIGTLSRIQEGDDNVSDYPIAESTLQLNHMNSNEVSIDECLLSNLRQLNLVSRYENSALESYDERPSSSFLRFEKKPQNNLISKHLTEISRNSSGSRSSTPAKALNLEELLLKLVSSSDIELHSNSIDAIQSSTIDNQNWKSRNLPTAEKRYGIYSGRTPSLNSFKDEEASRNHILTNYEHHKKLYTLLSETIKNEIYPELINLQRKVDELNKSSSSDEYDSSNSYENDGSFGSTSDMTVQSTLNSTLDSEILPLESAQPQTNLKSNDINLRSNSFWEGNKSAMYEIDPNECKDDNNDKSLNDGEISNSGIELDLLSHNQKVIKALIETEANRGETELYSTDIAIDDTMDEVRDSVKNLSTEVNTIFKRLSLIRSLVEEDNTIVLQKLNQLSPQVLNDVQHPSMNITHKNQTLSDHGDMDGTHLQNEPPIPPPHLEKFINNQDRHLFYDSSTYSSEPTIISHDIIRLLPKLDKSLQLKPQCNSIEYDHSSFTDLNTAPRASIAKIDKKVQFHDQLKTYHEYVNGVSMITHDKQPQKKKPIKKFFGLFKHTREITPVIGISNKQGDLPFMEYSNQNR